MQEENNFDKLLNRYKELNEKKEAENNKCLIKIQALNNEMLEILGLSEWDEDEISKRMPYLSNEDRIKINQLSLAIKELSDNTLSDAFKDYDANNKTIDAFIDIVRESIQDDNLSEEDTQDLQNLMAQIEKMQGEDLKNYPKIQEIRNKLENDKDI